MRKKILKFTVALITSLCSIAFFKAVSSTSGSFSLQKAGKFYSSSMWSTIDDGFQLNYYGNNKAVKKQIAWFKKHQNYITELTQNANPYIFYIYQETQRRGLPAELALMPMVESSYKPSATSNKAAAGLWQLIDDTAQGFGIKINRWYDGRRDLVASTHASLSYLQYLYDRFHNWPLAIAAYNSGEGRVLKAIKEAQSHGRPTDFWSLNLPQETRQYVPKILALAQIVRADDHYGLKLEPVANRAYFTQIKMDKPIDLNLLAQKADVSVDTLKELNAGFRQGKTTIPKSSYYLLIPAEATYRIKKLLPLLMKAQQSAAKVKTSVINYIVKKGDTVAKIAKKYQVSISSLLKKNNLSSVSAVHANQVLKIESSASQITK